MKLSSNIENTTFYCYRTDFNKSRHVIAKYNRIWFCW